MPGAWWTVNTGLAGVPDRSPIDASVTFGPALCDGLLAEYVGRVVDRRGAGMQHCEAFAERSGGDCDGTDCRRKAASA